ncbi:GOLPH3/VPS74 family protein [Saccharopolyspora taberi]|uniref:GPP34 family phosphoprotein n=1 Tax=Saccharopolyspora taberi TaxID=60895 RepID=A0ABN3VNF5_9PSEU
MELDLVSELALAGRTEDGRGHTGSALAVAAGELAELSMRGRLAIDFRHATVADPNPTGHPDLDQVLGWLLAHGRPMRLHRCLNGRAQHYGWMLNRLAGAGLFAVDSKKVMGMFPTHRYVPLQTARNVALNRLWELLRGHREADRRTIAFGGILWGTGLARELIPYKDDLRLLRRFAEHDPLGRAAASIIASNQAAASVAATTTVTATAF